MTTRLLQKAMLKEESAVIGGNTSMKLGIPSTPSLSSSGTGSTLPTATYSVIVVGLAFEGVRNSSVINGVATSKTVTGADGKSFILNGGSSNKSTNATQAVTLGAPLICTVAALAGACAYAWFVGTVGNEVLQRITTINSAVFSVPLTTGTQNASVITADCSWNGTAFDGLLTTALKTGSGAYVNTLAQGVAGTGTLLTASGKGGVNEIDNMLQSMWDASQVSPTVLWVNSQEQKNITSRALVGANTAQSPLLQYHQDPANGEVRMTAGSVVDYYFNPFLNGGMRIPVKVHPMIPAGTILGYADNLPIQYQSSEVPNVAEVKVRRDYYQVDWPVTTRAQMVGVYTEEALAVYAPFALGVINNIANG